MKHPRRLFQLGNYVTLRLKAILLLLAATAAATDSANLYRDGLTGFADVSRFDCGSTITISNDSDGPVFETLPLRNDDNEFTYYLRIRDNRTKKSGWVKRNAVGSLYGLVWNFCDSLNYEYATFQRTKKSDDDIVSESVYAVRLGEFINGRDSLISSTEIHSGTMSNADNNYNTIGLISHGDRLEVVAGHNELSKIVITSHKRQASGIGYVVGGKSAVSIKSIEYTSANVGCVGIESGFDERSLSDALNNDRDPLTGYWAYLDRKTDDKHFTLGGKYQIAIVKSSETTYSIVYLTGAELYPELWKPYTLKGRLTVTPFIGNYNLEWTDAQGKVITDESFASFQDGILTLHFPLYGSTVRFYKSSSPQ